MGASNDQKDRIPEAVMLYYTNMASSFEAAHARKQQDLPSIWVWADNINVTIVPNIDHIQREMI